MTIRSLIGKLFRTKLETLLATTIHTGRIIVTEPDGRTFSVGDASAGSVSLRIMSWETVGGLVIDPDLAFGEAFMNGDIRLEKGSIYDLLKIVFENIGASDVPGPSWLTRFLFRAFRALGSYNDPVRSKQNVAHHYDLDGKLYDLFLDDDRQYSCGYFEGPNASLDEAQLAKKRHLAAKLALQPNHNVLDIGSGWGGLALYLARTSDVFVKGVTLSEEQLAVSHERAENEARVSFNLQDYRSVEERFDRIVSVGMFEHVGRKSYDEFFSTVHRLLNDDGVAVLHYIGRFTKPYETNSWILKYIFPGGYMPSLSEVLPKIEQQGLIVTDIEVLRLHYADTLRHWRERFLANRDKAVALYDERFARMWEFYLAASETGFRYQGLVIHQIQMTKSQGVLPLTRDYILQAEQALQDRETGSGYGLMNRAAE